MRSFILFPEMDPGANSAEKKDEASALATLGSSTEAYDVARVSMVQLLYSAL